MRETWYVLEDGSVADPAECACDADGVLRHSSGTAVARRGDAYSSRGVDPVEERAVGREMKPAPGSKKPYRTRDSKAG